MLILRENQKGQFHLENLGVKWGGPQGDEYFSLRIEGKSHGLILEVDDVTIFDLDPKVNLSGREFNENRIFLPDLIRVRASPRELTIEVAPGSFYDLIKERVAMGGAKITAGLPVTVYYRGLVEAA